MSITKNCDNCDAAFSVHNELCFHCTRSPKKVDNFSAKVPKIQFQNFEVEFQHFEDLLEKGFSWDIESSEDGSTNYDEAVLVIYVEEVILRTKLTKALSMLTYKNCKVRVAELYNLPLS